MPAKPMSKGGTTMNTRTSRKGCIPPFPDERAGFTLLELLMVVIIIGILAAVALPQYVRMAERARSSEALSILAAIRGAEVRFRAQNPAGAYTTTLAQLDTDIPGVGSALASALWAYTVSGAGAGSNAVATRAVSVSVFSGESGIPTITLDLDSGATCSSHPNTYGLSSGSC